MTFTETRARAAIRAYTESRAAPVAPTVDSATGYRTRLQAAARASRCGAPNTVADGEERADGLWAPVLRIRPDQEWMRAVAEERGVVVLVLS